MQQQVDDAWRFAAEQLGVEHLQLRPDAGQAGQRGKQRIEDERAHGRMLAFALRTRNAAVHKQTLTSPSNHSIKRLPAPSGFLALENFLSGTNQSSNGLDERRKRLKFRLWHRGIREMDLVLGDFADAELAGLADTDLAEVESWLEVPDQQMFAWVNGAETPPAGIDTTLFRKLRTFHLRDAKS